MASITKNNLLNINHIFALVAFFALTFLHTENKYSNISSFLPSFNPFYLILFPYYILTLK